MTIKQYIRNGIATILGLLVVASTVTLYGANQIRIGGPLHIAENQASDLIADILPPPEYVIEPYLEATLLLHDPASLARRKARLEALHKEYQVRRTHWQQEEMPAKLKSLLVEDAGRPAEAFWSELDKNMLPAIAAGNMLTAQSSYTKLSGHYARHRAAIDRTVAAASGRTAEIQQKALSALISSFLVLGLLAAIWLGFLALSVWFLLRRVVIPIDQTAHVMKVMADGNNGVSVPGTDRDDEIGTMAHAIEKFRTAAITRIETENSLHAAEDRVAIVKSIGTALSALANGDVTHRLDTPFPGDFEAVRRDFNHAMDELQSILLRIADSARSIDTGAAEIRLASDDMARRTETQAASLEEASAALNQITASVRGSAAGANSARQAVTQTRGNATEGGDVVR